MTKKEASKEDIKRDLELLEINLNESLVSEIDLATEISNYTISSGGKRIRPLISILIARCLNYSGAKILPLATAIELLHTATLIHDDVVDESEIRRGKLSVNKKWDAKHSVLIGDFVYSKAFQIIASLKDQNIIKTLANSTNKISEGEVMQLSLLKTFISEEEYFEIIGRKTAELFQASALSAAYLAKANSEQLSIIRDLSFAIGITFQINDDLLDYFGDSSKTGKKIGQDLVEGKITLPLIKAYRLSNDKNKLILRNALGKSSKEDMDNVIKIIRSSGAIEEVIKIRDKYFLICKKNILKLPNSSFRDYLFATAKAFNNIDI